jgi:hypothetical protein
MAERDLEMMKEGDIFLHLHHDAIPIVFSESEIMGKRQWHISMHPMVAKEIAKMVPELLERLKAFGWDLEETQ